MKKLLKKILAWFKRKILTIKYDTVSFKDYYNKNKNHSKNWIIKEICITASSINGGGWITQEYKKSLKECSRKHLFRSLMILKLTETQSKISIRKVNHE